MTVLKLAFYIDAEGQHRWRLVSVGNREVVGASSEGFASRQKAHENFELVRSSPYEEEESP